MSWRFIIGIVVIFLAVVSISSLTTAEEKRSTPEARLRQALARAKENDAEAIPVVIDLLADLSREQRRPAEQLLRHLAGEWAPPADSGGEDEIGRRIRRDAWMAWWRNTSGEALLADVRKFAADADAADKVRRLIADLDAKPFAARQSAARKLSALGRIALPQLRQAVKKAKPEMARRITALINDIDGDSSRRLPLAVLRLLAVRKPRGAAADLLAYLPAAEDEEHDNEVRKTLAVLAVHDGKLDADLLRALKDENPIRRAAAAEALVQGGGSAGQEAVRSLAHTDKPAVRLRIALALARAGQRDGVSVLVDLLTVLSDDESGQAEEALCQLAGDSAPEIIAGSDKAAKKKCHDAWAAWWRLNAKRVDLARLKKPLLLGYTLICDVNSNRVFEIDRHGKERWAIDNLQYPLDACMVPGGRVLIAEYRAMRVTERDLKGNIVWQKQISGRPVSVQRLRNGHTLIATMYQGIHEVDRSGNDIANFNNIPGGLSAAYRSRKGVTVCQSRNGQCFLLDAAGKQIRSFAADNGVYRNFGRLDVLRNGRILIAQDQRGKVVEFDDEGKKQMEVDAPGVTTAVGLSNGRILVASQGGQRVYELTRSGKIVWEHKITGHPFRARRR